MFGSGDTGRRETAVLMKTLWGGLCVLLVAWSVGYAADDASSSPAIGGESNAIDPGDLPPELRGILMVGAERRFTLATPGGTQSGWAAIGEAFNDWELVEYRDAEQVLLVRKEGLDVAVPLATSTIIEDEATRLATQAQAEALIKQMNFEQMFERLIEQQKKSMVGLMRQAMPKEAAAHLGPEELAFQERVMDVMWSEMNPAQMGADMAKAYAEVFTPAELRGMAEFYATSAGQAMIDKQPELQQRMMQSMMPRIMAAMPKIQQMGQEFRAAQRAKREAADTGGPGHPTGTADP